MLAEATEKNAISPVGKVIRLIDNKAVEVRYFSIGGRIPFVIEEEKDGIFQVLIIESPHIR